MGGDQGPRSCIRACLKFLSTYSNTLIILIGDRAQILPHLPYPLPTALLVEHTEQNVLMSEKPSVALRHKRASSMAVAVAMVARGRAHACVSSGNTGALMAFGLHYLQLKEGIERPAICKAMPSSKGICYLLDIGANAQCTALNLLQFAQLGRDFAKVQGVVNPRIGLLNIGIEAQKGANLQRAAADLMSSDSTLNFIGYVEGGDIYRSIADVVVCDGFSGNILLKASEGAAELMGNSLRQAFNRHWWARLSSFLMLPILSDWRKQFDPSQYNGAQFLGLNGTIIKSHGGAGEVGFISALRVALEQASSNENTFNEKNMGIGE